MTEYINPQKGMECAAKTNRQRHPLLHIKVKLCRTDVWPSWEGEYPNYRKVTKTHWWAGLVDGVKIVGQLTGWHTREEAEALVKQFQEELDKMGQNGG